MSNVLHGKTRVSARFGLGAFEEGAEDDVDVYAPAEDRAAYDFTLSKLLACLVCFSGCITFTLLSGFSMLCVRKYVVCVLVCCVCISVLCVS